MQEYVAGLTASTEQAERATRAWHRWQIVSAVMGSLGFLGAVGLTIWLLQQAWQTGDWSDFWGSVAPAVGFLVLVWIAPLLRYAASLFARLREEVAPLRRIALEGDVRLAPLASKQPEALAGADLPIERASFRFVHPNADGRLRLIESAFTGIFFAVQGGLLLVLPIITLLSPPRDLPGPPPDPVLMWAAFAVEMVFGILLLAASFIGLRWVWGRLRGVRLVADASGLRQTNGAPRSGGIRWHEARAFYQIEIRTIFGEVLRETYREVGLPADDDPFWLRQVVYVLDSGERLIVWALPRRASPAMLAARPPPWDHRRAHAAAAARRDGPGGEDGRRADGVTQAVQAKDIGTRASSCWDQRTCDGRLRNPAPDAREDRRVGCACATAGAPLFRWRRAASVPDTADPAIR